MSTLSRSQSSVMGGEDYFMWREKMERCQRENDRQMWTLFRQMKQLKEENEELQTQMSSSGPFLESAHSELTHDFEANF
ncbi:hypothetical protein CK203_018514 [Vitis vinifera]|uniref:Uncharacterized protein n=1 Tax=Vitis vinifera TaxID=29760 RepID=A0A438J5U5_VITVI|nr:hypothetical protein CK203_018514 [Vitis vinifera]